MNQPKVFFDARHTIVGRDSHFGVSRYGAELAEALAKLQPITLIISDERQLNLLPKGIPRVKLNSVMSLSELWVARKLNKLGADVVFTPLQFMGSWGRRYKLIATMHDTIYYRFPKPPYYLPLWVRALWWLSYQAIWPHRLLLNMADRVATVSETSKKEIKALKLTKRPIDVVYNSANKPAGITRSKKIKKDLVYVGSFMHYKNPETLVRAVNLLPDYKLHFVSPVTAERKADLQALANNPDQLVFWNGANDEKMYKLLSTATAGVHASKAEGFGLPVIETLSLGAPMICSDSEIFHEVGGKAAIYCDPDSPEQYAAAVRRLEDPKVAAEYAKKGLAQAKKFSWDVSARQLLKIIRRLANEAK